MLNLVVRKETARLQKVKLGRAIPLPALRALVACYRENLFLYLYMSLKACYKVEFLLSLEIIFSLSLFAHLSFKIYYDLF